jgi:hypothetical protein
MQKHPREPRQLDHTEVQKQKAAIIEQSRRRPLTASFDRRLALTRGNLSLRGTGCSIVKTLPVQCQADRSSCTNATG